MKYKYNNEWNTITTDGAPGKDGAPGLNGTPGEDGKSAYEYAKEGGYTGTEAEFIEKLAEEIVIPDVSGFMNKTNPTGTGSFSLNRKAGTLVGSNSAAEGYNCTASGRYSHAEGYGARATGEASHAEGQGSEASGSRSHAEGYNCTASGIHSHAECYKTEASGICSHAEGAGNKAASSYQHVQGKYNVGDPNDTYAHIVGNGASDTNRSNAHTLDWSGNGWFAGDIYVGGTGQNDEAAEKLATLSEVKALISEAMAAMPNAEDMSF